MNAAKRNYSETVELLINAGANFRAATPATEKSPSQIALDMTKDPRCVMLLKDAEAKLAAHERSLVTAEQARQLMAVLRSDNKKVFLRKV